MPFGPSDHRPIAPFPFATQSPFGNVSAIYERIYGVGLRDRPEGAGNRICGISSKPKRAAPSRQANAGLSRAGMYPHSPLAQHDRSTDLVSDRGLTLVGAKRTHARPALRVDGLSKCYGTLNAVTGVSFDVGHGEIFGLLGLNGAGKTTLISMLAAELRPSTGDAVLLGLGVRGQPRVVRRLIDVAPQQTALYPTLTAAENLSFFGRIYGVRRAELAR